MSEVTLREYFESQIKELREQVSLQFKNRDDNVNRQAKEYERRLGQLNNEQDRLAKDRERFVSREIYDQAVGALIEKVRLLELERANFAGKTAVVSGLAAMIVSVLVSIIMKMIGGH